VGGLKRMPNIYSGIYNPKNLSIDLKIDTVLRNIPNKLSNGYDFNCTV
jgi:hypothetical protein